MKVLCILSLLLCWLHSITLGDALKGERVKDFDRFLVHYCLDCHDDSIQKGDRQFDDLSFPINNNQLAERWQEILDVLLLGDMPPKDKKQPKDHELLAATDFLSKQLQQAEKDLYGHASSVVLRRLNKEEFIHTVQTIFQLPSSRYDFTHSFPEDDDHHGLLTNGEILKTSSNWIEAVLNGMDEIIARADEWRGLQPKVETIHLSGYDFRVGGGRTSVKSEHFHNCGTLFSRSSKVALGMVENFPDGVPHSGYYQISVEASAVGRVHRFPQWNIDPMDRDEGFILEIGVALYDPSPNGNMASNPDKIHQFYLEDEVRKEYSFETWLEKGEALTFRFANGLRQNRNFQMLNLMSKFYPERWPEDLDKEKKLPIGQAVKLMCSDNYPGPRIRIWDIKLNGPHYKTWPPQIHQSVFGQIASEPTITMVSKHLTHLASQAWRRPVRSEELKQVLDNTLKQLEDGIRYEEAVRKAIKWIMIHPAAQYMLEPNSCNGENVKLTSHQLATRLAYFMWSHPPDQELMQANLHNPTVLNEQVQRMMADPKWQNFCENFTEQWLKLGHLGKMPPNDTIFWIYHVEKLQSKMKQESAFYFKNAICENWPVRQLFTSNTTWLDRAMAKFYGLDYQNLKTGTFEKVSLPDNTQRQGLLGHASVLTVTSNGVETSPVTRGVWVLENILGIEPPPPPPDVPPLEPDIRGAKTLREQLDKHKSIATCASCHTKIDPLGFPLESFDPIGQYRKTYPSKHEIETHSHYRGADLRNHHDLINYLKSQESQIAENLLRQCMSYAVGREMQFSDQRELKALLKQWRENNYGLQYLPSLITSSSLFKRP